MVQPDMMVLEFDKPFDLVPDVVEPACLPTKKIEIGTQCFTSGWGDTSSWRSSKQLMAVDINVADHEDCLEKYEGVNLG